MIKSDLTRRERWLMTLFPAAIVLAVYSVVFVIPAQRRLAASRLQLTQVSISATNRADAELSRQKLDEARQSLERLKARIGSARQTIQELGRSWRLASNRLEAISQITEMLRTHNLSVVFQGYAEKPELSEYGHDLVDVINRHSRQQELEYWQLDVQGSFLDVTRFLQAIDYRKLMIVPFAIRMQPSTDRSPGASWTIFFLI